MKFLRSAVPTGTLVIAAGVGLLGLASYVHLAVAGHSLAQNDMAALAVLWSIVFAVAPGLFLPLEQEVTRLVAERRTAGTPLGPVLTRGVQLVLLVVAVAAVPCAAFGRQIADLLFQGDVTLVWIVWAALGAHAAGHVTRGILAGLGKFGWYGSQLAVDGLLRLGGTALIAGSASAASYAWLLAIAPLAAVVVTVVPLPRAWTPGETIGWKSFLPRLGLLTTSAFMMQLMVNVAVINAQLLSPDQTQIAVALLSAMVMVRIPIFLFGAMHAALLAGATHSVTRADWAGLKSLVSKSILVVTALAGAAALVLIPAGTTLSQWLFNAPDVLTELDFLLLTTGVMAYLWAFVLGQVAIALQLHGSQTGCWAAGTAMLFLITALPLQLPLRVELGFVCGAVTTALLLAWRVRASVPASSPLAGLTGEVAS